MGLKNPFDRRSKDDRVIDDAVVGLPSLPWSDAERAGRNRFARAMLEAWRPVVDTEDARDASEVRRLDRVRQSIDRRGGVRGLDPAESARIKAIRASVRGRIAVSAVVVGTAIESLDAWTAEEVAHRVVRIDLAGEVAAICRSAFLLESACTKLERPTGHLADDEEVMRIYRSRTEALTERQQVLLTRLSALRSYLDGLSSMQRELERMRWIRRHGEPDEAELHARESDELGSMTVSAARDMFDEAADRIGVQMRDAAARLHGPVQ